VGANVVPADPGLSLKDLLQLVVVGVQSIPKHLSSSDPNT